VLQYRTSGTRETPAQVSIFMPADPKINVLLPEHGPGFVTGNREARGADQYGTCETISIIQIAGATWQHPDRAPFSVGDISRKGGGRFPPHTSHQTGKDFDVRPLRKDKQNKPVTITDPQYDREATLQLLETFWRTESVKLILFNDPAAIRAKLSRPYPGHHNHFHVRLT
jgi:murein endopeptidase